jgi:hypothetical protein
MFFSIASISAENGASHLSNKGLACYKYINLLGDLIWSDHSSTSDWYELAQTSGYKRFLKMEAIGSSEVTTFHLHNGIFLLHIL